MYLAALTVVGYQSVLFAILTKIYAQHEGFRIPRSRNFDRLERRISLESGALVGLALFFVGLAIGIWQLSTWAGEGFGSLDPSGTVRTAVLAALLMMLGAQTIMAGLFLTSAHPHGRPRRRDRGVGRRRGARRMSTIIDVMLPYTATSTS